MRIRPRARLVALPLAVLAVALPALATAAPSQASGKFESRNWEFEPVGAYAYPGEVGLDDEAGIVVAISNSPFDAEFFDGYWDRGHAIETYHKDDETLVASLQFAKSGAYKGITYYFESGDGCGYCYDGSVRSAVRVEKGKIFGKVTLVGKPGELAFDVTFDVPVAPSSYGEPLPAGGGEPGKVYAAYHQALAAWDKAALRPFYTEKVQGNYTERADAVVQAFRSDHPDQAMKVVRGFARGDRALLLVEGETSYSKVKTEVHLEKQKGTWRIVDETLQIRMEE
jgi:hypothetical protein